MRRRMRGATSTTNILKGLIDSELDEEEGETRREAATFETSRRFRSSVSLGPRSAELVRISFVEPELD